MKKYLNILENKTKVITKFYPNKNSISNIYYKINFASQKAFFNIGSHTIFTFLKKLL